MIEINKDIVNLRTVLQTAIVPAINLELAFMNAIDKQIKILIDSMGGCETAEQMIFNDFFTKMVSKIKTSDINGINAKIDEQKIRMLLLDEMKEFKL